VLVLLHPLVIGLCALMPLIVLILISLPLISLPCFPLLILLMLILPLIGVDSYFPSAKCRARGKGNNECERCDYK
jgi:hypothetical protein